MPMPSYKKYLPSRTDFCSLTDGDIITAVESAIIDGYAAGKADALPPWPPEGGSTFSWACKGDGINRIVKWSSMRCYWMPFLWESEPKDSSGNLANDEIQCLLTAAYFRGELEEVK